MMVSAMRSREGSGDTNMVDASSNSHGEKDDMANGDQEGGQSLQVPESEGTSNTIASTAERNAVMDGGTIPMSQPLVRLPSLQQPIGGPVNHHLFDNQDVSMVKSNPMDANNDALSYAIAASAVPPSLMHLNMAAPPPALMNMNMNLGHGASPALINMNMAGPAPGVPGVPPNLMDMSAGPPLMNMGGVPPNYMNMNMAASSAAAPNYMNMNMAATSAPPNYMNMNMNMAAPSAVPPNYMNMNMNMNMNMAGSSHHMPNYMNMNLGAAVPPNLMNMEPRKPNTHDLVLSRIRSLAASGMAKMQNTSSGEDEEDNYANVDVNPSKKRLPRRRATDSSEEEEEEETDESESSDGEEDIDNIDIEKGEAVPSVDGTVRFPVEGGIPKVIERAPSSRPVRSAVKTRSVYVEESDSEHSSDIASGGDGSSGEEDEAEEKVESILQWRFKNWEDSGRNADREFLCKYFERSYIASQWIPYDELAKGSKADQIRLRLFMKRDRPHMNKKDPPYDPSFAEIDHVICCSDPVAAADDVDDEGAPVIAIWYLVKWAGLEHRDATWESEESIRELDDGKFDIFLRHNVIPDAGSVVPSTSHHRPPSSEWDALRVAFMGEDEQGSVYKFGNRLFSYQLTGVSWLLYQWFSHNDCILADEMGLGKTIQSLAFIHQLITVHKRRGPHLVIAPLSTLTNWAREAESWMDLNVLIYHGNARSREVIQEMEFFFKDDAKTVRPHIVITSYEMVVRDAEFMSAILWDTLTLDEAHRLKNKDGRLGADLRSFSFNHKVLLTGTPLQNNLTELWALLNFLNDDKYPSEAMFLATYGDLEKDEDGERVRLLQENLNKLMLRRTKSTVARKVPPKEEVIVEVEQTRTQKLFYKAIMERNFTFLLQGAKKSNVTNLSNVMMELRKCCNHPYLIAGAEEKVIAESRDSVEGPYNELNTLISSSGKLILLDKLLPRLHSEGHKVLIFSQMTHCLDILQDYLSLKEWNFERIDGTISSTMRARAIDRFQDPTNDKSFVFLLSTRAGGMGINLTRADTVIIYDSDWNPQNDLQAMARCHRIGQDKSVKIYRLVTKGSYERKMFDIAARKLGLDRALLSNIANSNESASAKDNTKNKLTAEEMIELIKEGAYSSIMSNDADDAATKAFVEDDIDAILDRSSFAVHADTDADVGILSKVTFGSKNDEKKADIDDPAFWHKWASEAGMNYDELVEDNKPSLIVHGPRRRNAVRYNYNVKEGKGRGRGRGKLKELPKRRGRFNNVDDDDFLGDLPFDSDFDDDGGDDSADWTGKKRSSSSIGRGEFVTSKWTRERRVWSNKMVIQLDIQLMRLGWGAWKAILDTTPALLVAGLEADDVRAGAEAYLRLCLLNGDKDADWSAVLSKTMQIPESAYRPNYRNNKEVAPADELDVYVFQADFGPAPTKEKYCTKGGRLVPRLRLIHLIGEALTALDTERVAKSDARFKTLKPTEWWNVACDRWLLQGTLTYGYGLYRVMAKAMPFPFPLPAAQQEADMAAKALAVEGVIGTEQTVAGLPTPKILTGRIHRLCSDVGRIPLKRSLYTKAQKIVEDRQRREDARNRQWVGKEKILFRRGIIAFGIFSPSQESAPSWEVFRSVAPLDRKTDEQLAARTAVFALQARCALDGDISDHLALSISANDAYISQMSDDALYENAGVDEAELAGLVDKTMANRMQYRGELYTRLVTQVLPHEDLEKILSSGLKKPTNMPFWIPGKHDHMLLQAVSKHGFSPFHIFTEYDFNKSNNTTKKRRTSASELSMRGVASPDRCSGEKSVDEDDDDNNGSSNAEVATRTRRGRTSNMFPNEKAVILRVEYLCNIVLHPSDTFSDDGSSVESKMRKGDDGKRKKKLKDVSIETFFVGKTTKNGNSKSNKGKIRAADNSNEYESDLNGDSDDTIDLPEGKRRKVTTQDEVSDEEMPAYSDESS